jgi:selenocysteine-specific elongation factor
MGDRFVVRDVGRRVVVGGGTVLDPHPPKSTPGRETATFLLAAVDGDPDTRAAALLAVRGAARTADLSVDSGGGRPDAAVVVGDQALTPAHLDAALLELRRLVTRFHGDHPLRPGIPKATLASAAGLAPEVVAAVVAGPGSGLVERASMVADEGFVASWGADETRAWAEAEHTLRTSGLSVPRVSSLGLDPEVLHRVIRDGRLVVVGDDVAYLPGQIEEIVDRLETLAHRFTVAEFRDALGLSRRQAVPLLEWLDAAGHTRRTGDMRQVRRRRPPASDAAPTP